ncbi:MAG TPA: D-alanine--D-alanine ligase family protein [Acidimicrobiales bacterium]
MAESPVTPPSPAPVVTGERGRIRLVVLFGGQSAEHDVSRVTARHVLAAADPDRYDILPVGITRTGEWVRAEAAIEALAAGVEALPESLAVEGTTLNPLATVAPAAGPVVVLPLLHGPMGEDGTVQGLLEVAGVPYVGSGVLGSAISMDKIAAKHLADASGFAQVNWRGLHRSDLVGDDTGDLSPEALDTLVVADLIDALGFPMFVKPANMGSSIGVSKAKDEAALRAGLVAALAHDEWLVVEEGVVAREIEVAVLGHTTSPRASVPGEIVPGAEFYDYEDKYADGVADLRVPAPLPTDVADEARELACRVFRTYRAEGMARVDFLYEEGARGLLLNELNTIPGFTPISMYPSLWQATGLPYRALIDELVGLALERHEQVRRRR